ncbi:hypothetical protein OAC93_02620 [Flavobacteriaceae bacterium]|jgi:hypothetical protein|nr:hypothetical protein [Flavobacteriaceae bacterium]MDB0043642.1 hypothetical protein [Flavobacteriaceae bacterium]MDB4049761.1 hypothetical protein [Flavobacteriaceae bacterium]MDB4087240.1 hypothetical protein [Flavobacteriaceae bacterium]MDB4240002.1 hypothetical protein [Flavobacteriaceae bacterium]
MPKRKGVVFICIHHKIQSTPIIIEFSLWGNSNMREFNEIDNIEGLNLDKTLIIQSIQDSYNSMLLN